MLFVVTLALAGPAAAEPDDPGLFAHNLNDLPLAAGQEPDGLVLQQVVLLMRHGVRPPTRTDALQPYADRPFPSWDVPDGHLTAHGAALIDRLGASLRATYAGEGLLAAAGCPRPGDLFVWADNADQRTRATGSALVGGLYPGCGVPAAFSPDAARDPLFSPGFPADGAALTRAVLARMGGGFAALDARIAPLLAQMSETLGCVTPSCRFLAEPSSLTVKDSRVLLTGPLNIGGEVAQVFELEYANGFPPPEVAFGRRDLAGVLALERLFTLKYAVIDRTPLLARARGSNIARQMLRVITGAATQQDGPPPARLTVFVGHDTTIVALAALLDLHWAPPGLPVDDVPAGSALGFERLAAPDGTHYIRPIALFQPLAAMHELPPRVPLIRLALQLRGCARDTGRLCDLAGFAYRLAAAIDPAATAPARFPSPVYALPGSTADATPHPAPASAR